MAMLTLTLDSQLTRVLDMAEYLDITYEDPRGDMNFVFIGTSEALDKLEVYSTFVGLTEDMSDPESLASDIDNTFSRGDLATLWELMEEVGEEDEDAVMACVAEIQ